MDLIGEKRLRGSDKEDVEGTPNGEKRVKLCVDDFTIGFRATILYVPIFLPQGYPSFDLQGMQSGDVM